MNSSAINDQSICALAIALKEIHDNITHGYTKISLQQLLKAHRIPYYGTIPTILLNKGILNHGFSRNQWLWTTKTEPNTIMAEAVLREAIKSFDKYPTEKSLRIIAIEMYNNNKTLDEIANTVHRHKGTISKWLHGIHHSRDEHMPRTVHHQPIQINQSITPLATLAQQINIMKKGLMSLGWSESDAISLIKQQIK